VANPDIEGENAVLIGTATIDTLRVTLYRLNRLLRGLRTGCT